MPTIETLKAEYLEAENAHAALSAGEDAGYTFADAPKIVARANDAARAYFSALYPDMLAEHAIGGAS